MTEFIEAVIRTLRAEWSLDIWDPKTSWIERLNAGEDAPSTAFWSARIELYFRTAGPVWAGRLDKRRGIVKYRPKSDAWCGMFVGYGFANPDGSPFRVDPRISELVFPSTYRLNSRAFWNRAGHEKLKSLRPCDVQRGDVLTVRTRRTDPKAYGDHIVLALGPAGPDGEIPTIEGNAQGGKPTGPWSRQGVVIRTRPVEDVRRVYRLGPEHLTEK